MILPSQIALSISSAAIFLNLTFSVWVKEITYFPVLTLARIASISIVTYHCIKPSISSNLRSISAFFIPKMAP